MSIWLARLNATGYPDTDKWRRVPVWTPRFVNLLGNRLYLTGDLKAGQLSSQRNLLIVFITPACSPPWSPLSPLSTTTFVNMHAQTLLLALSSTAFAARPFLNEPDTGIEEALGGLFTGGRSSAEAPLSAAALSNDSAPGQPPNDSSQLPNVTAMVSLHDFDWLARKHLPIKSYTYYRNGAAGEWSYRNNLEVFRRYRLKPRVLRDISKIQSTLPYGPVTLLVDVL